MNNVVFIKGQGGLGYPLPGKDYISSLLFYTNSLPAGFSSTDRIKAVFSLNEAEALGVTNNFADETKATGVFTISASGATGDQIELKYLEPTGVNVSLGSYVVASGDTNTLIAAGLVAAINAGTSVHGYSASNTGAAITITVKAGLGIYPNGGAYLTATIVGTVAGSVTTAFAGGVASKLAVYHYHISEFFRIQPKGKLWLAFFAVPSGAYDFAEVQTIQTFTNGEVRQMGVYVDSVAFNVTQTSAIQAKVNVLEGMKMGLSVIYAANMAAVSDLSTLADLAVLTNSNVSVVLSQDGAGAGFQLWKTVGKSITTLGATLGTVALAAVNENIAWVGKFNLSDGIELESIAFANGASVVSAGLQDSLDVKRYIFLRKFPNLAGSYFNDSHTCISQSSDYAYIENNRVIDKVVRGVDSSLLPSLNSPLTLKSNGTLANSTIAFLQSQAMVNINDMLRNGELSAVSVTIDPTQNVASTSNVNITIKIVPIGVARTITIKIAYAASL